MRRAGALLSGARHARAWTTVVTVLVLTFVAWAPAGAQDYPGGQSTSGPLGVNPGTAPPGGTTTISGGGCLPGTTFTVFLGPDELTTGTVSADGRVDATVTIPFDAVPGSYTLSVVCTGENEAERTLTGALSVVLQSPGGGSGGLGGLPFTGASSDRLIRIGVALCGAGAVAAAVARWLIGRRSATEATPAEREPEVAVGG
ncbi:MAG: hypothetical protein S0880_03480 [Actinomycetota bacterium]|nr:hypothetical protein [Actinomycetota bacterium]